VIHTYNPSLQKAEAGGLGVQGQPGPFSETLYHKKITESNGTTFNCITVNYI
jgi:hypothetical protein